MCEIEAFFSKSLYQHREKSAVNSTLAVYVLGMPRSGSTLVEQILSGHYNFCLLSRNNYAICIYQEIAVKVNVVDGELVDSS